MEIKFSIFILLHLYIYSQMNQTINDIMEGIFRIDSLYNNYTLAIREDIIVLTEEKDGDNQMFFITSTFLNSYFIISRDKNKRIGIDDDNKLYLYKIEDKNNIERTYWNIIKYENNSNIFLIQNVFNQQYLEASMENNKGIQYDIQYDILNKENNTKNLFKFSLFKLYEEVQIRLIDIEMVNKDPIDVFIKYTDFADKTINRKGIKETLKENDLDELKYCIRSILKYIPWIRKIFIVIPNDKVRFLKPIEEIKDKFVFIKEKDLIGFETINPASLEFRLFELKKYGISDNFIYMNDNYFIGQNLKKTDFFYYDDETQKVVPAIVNDVQFVPSFVPLINEEPVE